MDDHVGRVPASVEAQITLEPAGGMFGVNVRQQDVVVGGNDVAVGAFQPTLSSVCVAAVEILVQLQMLLDEEPVVRRERTRPGHTFVQTHE